MFFRRRQSAFEQNITLTEFEDMLPYEREMYLILMKNKLDEFKEQQNNNK